MFDLFCRKSQELISFRILSPCPKCSAQIRKAYILWNYPLWGVYVPWYRICSTILSNKISHKLVAEQLESEIKKNPTKPYIYDIECPNCGFLTKKGFTYIQIKSKEYK